MTRDEALFMLQALVNREMNETERSLRIANKITRADVREAAVRNVEASLQRLRAVRSHLIEMRREEKTTT
ncbi:MAG: hypothetical protein K8L99_18250 [Anaerolineae bacterium]|nr:hypothetical protein [Anaerolineae bacterium]